MNAVYEIYKILGQTKRSYLKGHEDSFKKNKIETWEILLMFLKVVC